VDETVTNDNTWAVINVLLSVVLSNFEGSNMKTYIINGQTFNLVESDILPGWFQLVSEYTKEEIGIVHGKPVYSLCGYTVVYPHSNLSYQSIEYIDDWVIKNKDNPLKQVLGNYVEYDGKIIRYLTSYNEPSVIFTIDIDSSFTVTYTDSGNTETYPCRKTFIVCSRTSIVDVVSDMVENKLKRSIKTDGKLSDFYMKRIQLKDKKYDFPTFKTFDPDYDNYMNRGWWIEFRLTEFSKKIKEQWMPTHDRFAKGTISIEEMCSILKDNGLVVSPPPLFILS
jgi:hypothetical protein